jgi:hypothetical protein
MGGNLAFSLRTPAGKVMTIEKEWVLVRKSGIRGTNPAKSLLTNIIKTNIFQAY